MPFFFFPLPSVEMSFLFSMKIYKASVGRSVGKGAIGKRQGALGKGGGWASKRRITKQNDFINFVTKNQLRHKQSTSQLCHENSTDQDQDQDQDRTIFHLLI